MPSTSLFTWIALQRAGQSRMLTLMLAIGLAVFMWYGSAINHGHKDWSDAVEYAVTGQSLVLHGRFPYAPVPYEEALVSGAETYKRATAVYPNLGFMLAGSLIGLLRQDFSKINAVYLNLGFTLLTAVLLYRITSAVTRNRLWGLSIIALFFMQRDVFHHLSIPITDISLACFAPAAAWCMLNGNERLSGLCLGVGFLFREQAVFFAPFLPLLHPAAVDIRSNLLSRTTTKLLLGYAACFASCILLAKAGQLYFLAGSPATDYYLRELATSMDIGWAARWSNFKRSMVILSENYLHLSAILLMFACKHFTDRLPGSAKLIPSGLWVLLCIVFYTKGMPIHCIAILCVAFIIFKGPIPRLSTTCIFTAVAPFVILRLVWTHWVSEDTRYFLVGILFVFLAIYMIILESRLKTLLFTLVFCFFLLMPQARISPSRFLHLGKSTFSDIKIISEFPMQQGRSFPAGSILLGDSWYLCAYASENAIPVPAPPFEEFVKQDNKNIDGILLRRLRRGWQGEEVISDSFGNTFARMPIPEKIRNRIIHVYYKKTNASVAPNPP